MPRSLMVGFRAEAVPGEVIAVDHDELTEAHWYSRADLLAAIQDGLALPGPVSIARHIIEAWYGGRCPPLKVATHRGGATASELAGNIVFGAPDFYRPATLGQLQAVVARASRIRVLATGHSFSDLADSAGAQVTLAGMPPEVSVDSAASLARVPAGLSYAELAAALDRQGFALRNLASLPHISVAGACATATHGSGAANQNLAAAMTGLKLVTADGDLLELTRGRTASTAPSCTWAPSAWCPACS